MLARAFLYSLTILIGLIVSTKSKSPRLRQTVLLVLSYLLYLTWGPWLALVLLGSTGMNWLLGRSLQRTRRSLVLWTGIALNIALLSTFKYLPEIAGSASSPALRHFSHIVLPLGISFWTFQAMSYLFDLYGGAALDPSLPEFALFMVFFPVTISGPVCRLPAMLRQFRLPTAISRADLARGLSRIATGILMMMLAQLLGQGLRANEGINFGFDQATRWSGADAWCLACGFGFYLFFAFAGYSHIAIGAAKMLGFTIPENFDRPFLSASPSIFWTRQHMSLSFWIKDYVYFPLAMLRAQEWWAKLCLLISMVIFGLWHKATVLFLLFGCYHGVLLIGHRQVLELKKRFGWRPPQLSWSLISWFMTAALISLGWIFFRAPSLFQAGQMFRAVLSPGSYFEHFLPPTLYLLLAALAVGYAIALLVTSALDRRGAGPELETSPVIRVMAHHRWAWIAPLYFYAVLALAHMISHVAGAPSSPFVYRYY
jgi:alginate O-acetyltransferase complex protein AlgI